MKTFGTVGFTACAVDGGEWPTLRPGPWQQLEPQRRSRSCEEETRLLALTGVQFQFLGRPITVLCPGELSS
jgi:hypothetical protein